MAGFNHNEKIEIRFTTKQTNVNGAPDVRFEDVLGFLTRLETSLDGAMFDPHFDIGSATIVCRRWIEDEELWNVDLDGIIGTVNRVLTSRQWAM